VKVLLVYENEGERVIAERTAAQAVAVLGRELVSPICNHLNVHRPVMSARALGFRELFNGVTMEPEIKSYMQALERAVFVEDGQL
jgi:hypothetical protein